MQLTKDGETKTPDLEIVVSVPMYDSDDFTANGDMERIQSVGADFVKIGYRDPVRISDLWRALEIINAEQVR